MKRVYLTTSETIPASSKAGGYPPDIQQKLEGYKKESQQYENQTPHVRPYPMEKYETHKIKRVEESAEGDLTGSSSLINTTVPTATKIFTPTGKRVMKAIKKLPQRYQRKARKLVPALASMDLGGERLEHVLYDLTNPAKKLHVKNPEVVRIIIGNLKQNAVIDPSLYLDKTANLGL